MQMLSENDVASPMTAMRPSFGGVTRNNSGVADFTGAHSAAPTGRRGWLPSAQRQPLRAEFREIASGAHCHWCFGARVNPANDLCTSRTPGLAQLPYGHLCSNLTYSLTHPYSLFCRVGQIE